MLLNPRGLAVLSGMALTLSAGSAAAQARYALADLGVLPGMAHCTASGLNEAGAVVGYCSPAQENSTRPGSSGKAA